MRIYIALLAATALTACGGGSAPQTIGGAAVVGGNVGGSNNSVSGGPGTGVVAGTGSGTTAAATGFLSSPNETTYDALGALQSLVTTNNGVLYQANASTVRAPSGTVNYSPRDGIFTISLADTKANVSATVRFQDPAHRSDFSPYRSPSLSAPNLSGFNYLDAAGPANAGNVSDTYTFFYQRPGVSTNYVSLAGYVRDILNPPSSTVADTHERGALVFGVRTGQDSIPATGSATYTGGFLATMNNNPTLDNANRLGNYLQWIDGSSSISVDFGKATVGLSLTGVVEKAFLNSVEILNTTVKDGAIFKATASATIDLIHTAGFTGQFATAGFTNPDGTQLPVSFGSVSAGSTVAGASSVDGTFYGPGAVNVGGSFRIVGGVPDQRVDINGAFAGAKAP